MVAIPQNKPFTKHETAVHELLQKAGKPMKAYELLEALFETGVRSPMTVYRALEGLTSRDLIHKITRLNAFACKEPIQGQAMLASVICRHCQQAELVEISQEQIDSLFGTVDIKREDVVIEAIGNCHERNCKNKSPA